jgi:hypothetical protein
MKTIHYKHQASVGVIFDGTFYRLDLGEYKFNKPVTLGNTIDFKNIFLFYYCDKDYFIYPISGNAKYNEQLHSNILNKTRAK